MQSVTQWKMHTVPVNYRSLLLLAQMASYPGTSRFPFPISVDYRSLSPPPPRWLRILVHPIPGIPPAAILHAENVNLNSMIREACACLGM